MKRYLKFIAYLQVIGIILVVFGHSFHELPDDMVEIKSMLRLMPYSFHMPLFMFVSGFLMVYTTELATDKKPVCFGSFFCTKLKRLIVPFVVLTAIVFVPRALMSGFADEVISLDFNSFVRAFFFTQSLPIIYFWFLQASFLLLIVNYAFLKRFNNWVGYLIGCMVFMVPQVFPFFYHAHLSVYFFSITYAEEFGLFFIIGAAYCRYYERIEKLMAQAEFPVHRFSWKC